MMQYDNWSWEYFVEISLSFCAWYKHTCIDNFHIKHACVGYKAMVVRYLWKHRKPYMLNNIVLKYNTISSPVTD